MSIHRSVVLGVTGYGTEQSALPFAVREAAQRHGSLHLLHTFQVFPAGPPATPLVPADWQRERGSTLLIDAAKQASATTDDRLQVTTELRESSPLTALLAASEDADLLVLERKQRSRAERVFGGSILFGVASHAHCPTAVVPQGWEPSDTDRIVVGVDESAAPAEAVELAFTEAVARDATVVVLHAWRAAPLYDDVIFRRTSQAQWAAETTRILEAELETWRGRFPGVQVEFTVDYARPVDALVSASADADLIVVGRRTGPLTGGLGLGSAARAVVRQATCPVVVVPQSS